MRIVILMIHSHSIRSPRGAHVPIISVLSFYSRYLQYLIDELSNFLSYNLTHHNIYKLLSRREVAARSM